jgi:N-methylhydantoinase A
VNWIVPAGPLEPVNRVLAELASRARRALGARGFAPEAVELTYEGDFKFAGQAFEVTVPLPVRSLNEADRGELASTFTSTYERLYGPGTAWEGFPVLMLNARVTAVGRVASPLLQAADRNGQRPEEARSGSRVVVVPESGVREPLPTYLGDRLRPGMRVDGPALIDDVDTTVYLPAESRMEVDEYRNYRVMLS